MIQLAFYKGTSMLSKLIKCMTWPSPYSHASIVHTTPEEGMVVYESWRPGVVKHSGWGEHEAGTAIDLFRFKIPLTAKEEALIIAASESQLGHPYDWKGVLSFLFRCRMQAEGAWFCSEYQSWACSEGGRILQSCPCWAISPWMSSTSPIITPDGHARA